MISETKRSKNIQKLNKKQQMQPLKGMVIRIFATFFAVLLGFLAIVTAYYTFAFKISITPSGSLNPSDPFATPFVIQNDSLLWITNIKPYHCILRKVSTVNNEIFTNGNIIMELPSIPILESNEKTTILLPFRSVISLSSPINFADVEIVVSYYPAFIFFYKKEKRVHFVTAQSTDRTLQWVSKAMSE